MEEGRGAKALPEIALLILRCAAAVVSRGILLHIEGGFASCAGQFGVKLAEPAADRRAGVFRLPLNEPSVVTQVIESHCSFVGEMPRNRIIDMLVDFLGGGQPAESILVPVVTNHQVKLVLYGDNLPERTRVAGVEILEMLALYAGIELEKAGLEGGACA